MKSIFIVGADSQLGTDASAALSLDFDVVTDSCTFGASDALQRGQLIDQLRRFGPFGVVLFCLDINIQREVNYAVDIVPDVLSKPWLALSVLQELYPQVSGLELLVAIPVLDQDSTWGLSLPEEELASKIIDTSIQRFRASVNPSTDVYLRECHGLDATLRSVCSLLK